MWGGGGGGGGVAPHDIKNNVIGLCIYERLGITGVIHKLNQGCGLWYV